MIYGEFGRHPLYINIYKRMITFWHKTAINSTIPKLTTLLYQFILVNGLSTSDKLPWLNFIKKILNDCGLSEVFNNPSLYSTQGLASKVEDILKDQYLQYWRNTVAQSSKGIYYKHFKDNLRFEQYLLLSKSVYLPILKFRTCNHNLPVEAGRWCNIPRIERLCQLCSSPAVGDEFHYLFRCEALLQQRTLHIHKSLSEFPNLFKIKRLFTSNKAKDLKNLSKFIISLFKYVNENNKMP